MRNIFSIGLVMCLVGCSPSSTNDDKQSTTSAYAHMQTYIDENNVKPLAILEPSQRYNEELNRAAVLYENGFYEVHENEDGDLTSNTHSLEDNNSKVEFDIAPPYIYAVINDEELLEKGGLIDIVLDDGLTFASSIECTSTPRSSIFYYGDQVEDNEAISATLYIYDSMDNKLYEEQLN
ncbi:hypothetical protein ACFFGV_04410 [Pontibacillus salicampi]|uniref:Lipoprotein n=1 Tax=Pontibacillus salicampi TaxID=1449801 RepID=A0ABV6LKG8_9BACI